MGWSNSPHAWSPFRRELFERKLNYLLLYLANLIFDYTYKLPQYLIWVLNFPALIFYSSVLADDYC